MKSVDFREYFKKSLYIACSSYIEELQADLMGKKIYAFAITISDTWNVTSSTREYFQSRLKLQEKEKTDFAVPDFYLEVCGAEWCYVGNHEELFIDVNDKLNFLNLVTWGEKSFDDIDSKIDLAQLSVLNQQMLIYIIIDVMNALKHEKKFNNQNFEEDIYLGVQSNDPSEGYLLMMQKISKEVNSKNWHSKVIDYIKYQTI